MDLKEVKEQDRKRSEGKTSQIQECKGKESEMKAPLPDCSRNTTALGFRANAAKHINYKTYAPSSLMRECCPPLMSLGPGNR